MKFFKDNERVHYYTKKVSQLDESELSACSTLFSQNYGIYSNNHPDKDKRSKQIKLGKRYYSDLKTRNDSFVALAEYKNQIIGQAFYIVDTNPEGNLTWVIQLVVHKQYRKRGIGKKLLFSVWGFSNDYAWGLATTNPITIKTLEAATMRKVDLAFMEKKINAIKKIGKKVSFIKTEDIKIDKNNSTVFSNYYVSHEDIPKLVKAYGENWKFGELSEGFEWLAFTFKGQDLNNISHKDLDKLFEHSENCLVDAYSRMKMSEQGWAKHTHEEVDFIQRYIPNKDSFILDIGCGIGRHTAELFERGYKNIKAYDFSSIHIKNAKEMHPECSDSYQVQDVRKLHTKKADFALCLYDVIGSFPNEKDNEKILISLKRNLKRKSYAVVSVMNMELTKNIAKYKYDVYENSKKLFKLKASDTMQVTGNIFNPDYFVLDTKTNLVFRKEIFKGDGLLDSEYIIRDKRYTKDEISSLFEKHGFSVKQSLYVKAGQWNTPLSRATDMNAKEILLVVQKK